MATYPTSDLTLSTISSTSINASQTFPNTTIDDITQNETFDLADFNNRYTTLKNSINTHNTKLSTLQEGLNSINQFTAQSFNDNFTDIKNFVNGLKLRTDVDYFDVYICDSAPTDQYKILTSLDGQNRIPKNKQKFLCYFSRGNQYGTRDTDPIMKIGDTNFGKLRVYGLTSMKADCFGYGWYLCWGDDITNTINLSRLSEDNILGTVQSWLCVNNDYLWDGKVHRVLLAEDYVTERPWLVEKDSTNAHSERFYYNDVKKDEPITINKGYYYMKIVSDKLYLYDYKPFEGEVFQGTANVSSSSYTELNMTSENNKLYHIDIYSTDYVIGHGYSIQGFGVKYLYDKSLDYSRCYIPLYVLDMNYNSGDSILRQYTVQVNFGSNKIQVSSSDWSGTLKFTIFKENI